MLLPLLQHTLDPSCLHMIARSGLLQMFLWYTAMLICKSLVWNLDAYLCLCICRVKDTSIVIAVDEPPEEGLDQPLRLEKLANEVGAQSS